MMAKERRAIHGMKLVNQICEAIGVDVSMARRLVIEINTDLAVVVYVEQYGSTDLVGVDWAEGLAGATIEVLDK